MQHLLVRRYSCNPDHSERTYDWQHLPAQLQELRGADRAIGRNNSFGKVCEVHKRRGHRNCEQGPPACKKDTQPKAQFVQVHARGRFETARFQNARLMSSLMGLETNIPGQRDPGSRTRRREGRKCWLH